MSQRVCKFCGQKIHISVAEEKLITVNEMNDLEFTALEIAQFLMCQVEGLYAFFARHNVNYWNSHNKHHIVKGVKRAKVYHTSPTKKPFYKPKLNKRNLKKVPLGNPFHPVIQ